MTRACKQCGGTFTRRKYESAHRWDAREYCSATCSGAAKTAAAHRGPRPCHACHATLVRRPNERLGAFNRRNYCDRDCYKRHEATQRIARDAQRAAGRACNACGTPLERRAGENVNNFQNRNYCSDTCRYQRRTPTHARRKHRHEFDIGPLSRAVIEPHALGERHETIRVHTLGEPCAKHPSEKVGAYGCPACNAGASWAQRQRETTARPHRDGGR